MRGQKRCVNIEEEKIRFIDLFGGVGGFRLGLERASNNRLDIQKQRTKNIQKNVSYNQRRLRKFTCVYYADIDKYATAVYNYRFKEDYKPTDITKVKTCDIPDFDILCGGFPCQSFSLAGKRKGFEDTRGTLFFEICRIVRDKRPRMVFLENVKGLLSHDNGTTFAVILETLDELRYDVEWQVLNSKHFGVPQNRERVFIIGHLRGQSSGKVFPIGEGSENDIQYIYRPTRDGEYELGRRIYSKDGVSPILLSQGSDDIKISPTITQELSHSWGYNFQKNLGLIRRLTPRECERLQGFPDDWTLVPYQNRMMSDTQRYKMMGNAVTVNVIEAIGRKILEVEKSKEVDD